MIPSRLGMFLPAALLATAFGAGPPRTADARPPNIVFILIDDMPWFAA